MNKKFLVITLAIAVTGQSMRAGIKDALKEVFVYWPQALAPSIWGEGGDIPQVVKENGAKYQTAPNVLYDAQQKIYITNEQDDEGNCKPAQGNFTHDKKGTVFVLNNNDLIKVDADSKVGGTPVQSGVFVEKLERTMSKEERIDQYFTDKVEGKDSPAKAFNWWKHKYFEKRWCAISSVTMLLVAALIAKKGYDCYQKRAAQQSAVDFDEFEDEEESAEATAPQQPVAEKPAVTTQAATQTAPQAA